MSYTKNYFFNEYLDEDFSDDEFQQYIEMKQQQMEEEQNYIREILCRFDVEENK